MTQDGKPALPAGKVLHIDCFAGIAGDMFLGAMLDLGVPEQLVRQGLALLPLGEFELRVGRATRMGIVSTDVKVEVPTRSAAHAHRSFREIRKMLGSSGLDAPVKERALGIFSRLARAEGRLHGKEPDEVTFHEVGAVDSLVDIVGAAMALEHLRPARVSSRAVPLGRGSTRCAHGVLPVPSPAAVAILADVGAAVEDGGADLELCTPTGAAIVAETVAGFGGLPAARVVAAGYGAGDAELPDRANLLRLLLLDPLPDLDADREAVVVEANIDNMPPEWFGHLMDRLFAAGARDVWYTPIQMKKNRPAVTVSVLCSVTDRDRVGAALLSESTTIGLRSHRVSRTVLERRILEVDTPHGAVRVKVSGDGRQVLNAAPEYEDCRAAAARTGAPLKDVYAAAMAAYLNLANSRDQR